MEKEVHSYYKTLNSAFIGSNTLTGADAQQKKESVKCDACVRVAARPRELS